MHPYVIRNAPPPFQSEILDTCIVITVLISHLRIKKTKAVKLHNAATFQMLLYHLKKNKLMLHTYVTQFVDWCYHQCISFPKMLHTYVTWL